MLFAFVNFTEELWYSWSLIMLTRHGLIFTTQMAHWLSFLNMSCLVGRCVWGGSISNLENWSCGDYQFQVFLSNLYTFSVFACLLFCCTVLARTSSWTFRRRMKNGPPYLVPDVGESFQSFTICANTVCQIEDVPFLFLVCWGLFFFFSQSWMGVEFFLYVDMIILFVLYCINILH